MELIAGLDAATLAEKLRPPRPLAPVGGSLVGDPAPGSTIAWLAWWPPELPSLHAVIERARAAGATRLMAGGPPGNYVESGLREDDPRVAALLAAGFMMHGAHVDLTVRTDVAPMAASGVTVGRCGDDLGDAVRVAFGAGWAWEAARARSHDGLFAAHDSDGALLGFAAHSGNLAHRGTFGPIGVLPSARGRGVGAALATAVLEDLRARGFDEVTVPWVARGTVEFYASMVTITARTSRLALALALSDTGSP